MPTTWSGEPLPDPDLKKGRPSVFDKRDVKRERENEQRSVAHQVSVRDERKCRCCGRSEGLHHHHLHFKSRGGKNTVENELLVCKFCHALIHARQLWVLGLNANKRVTFEIHESAVVEIFGTKPLPAHVRIVTDRRR